MNEDRYIELAPLAALGALDGDELTGFEAHVASCDACRGERAVHEAVASRLALALAPVPPSLAVRRQLLDATQPAAGATRSTRPWLTPLLAAAATVLVATGLGMKLRDERDDALRQAEAARRSAAGLEAELRKAEADAAGLRRELAEAHAVRQLVVQPQSRLATLAGLKEAPQARARVLWSPESREAVLVVVGLPPAPEGKAYEVWVIEKTPVAAGVFRVDTDGKATFRLPVVDETARVKTFAVTLEPAAGVPAPTGPMVLAGNVV